MHARFHHTGHTLEPHQPARPIHSALPHRWVARGGSWRPGRPPFALVVCLERCKRHAGPFSDRAVAIKRRLVASDRRFLAAILCRVAPGAVSMYCQEPLKRSISMAFVPFRFNIIVGACRIRSLADASRRSLDVDVEPDENPCQLRLPGGPSQQSALKKLLILISRFARQFVPCLRLTARVPGSPEG